MHDELMGALAALPPRQRTVLVLRYFLDLPEAEVAAAMKCSLGTVKSTAARALARLEQTLRTTNATLRTTNATLRTTNDTLRTTNDPRSIPT